MSIGKNIQDLRQQRGISQKELAAIAGVSDKTVSSWETNRAIPRMGPIQRIADYFGISKSAIIEPVSVTINFDTLRKVNNADDLSSDEKNLVTDFRELDFCQQQTIINMLAFLKSQSANATPGVVQNNQNGHNFYNSNGNTITT